MTMNGTHDEVAVYDVMHESATRRMGEYARGVTSGGPDNEALTGMRAVRARARAESTHDIGSQLEATAEFKTTRDQLRLE